MFSPNHSNSFSISSNTSELPARYRRPRATTAAPAQSANLPKSSQIKLSDRACLQYLDREKSIIESAQRNLGVVQLTYPLLQSDWACGALISLAHQFRPEELLQKLDHAIEHFIASGKTITLKNEDIDQLISAATLLRKDNFDLETTKAGQLEKSSNTLLLQNSRPIHYIFDQLVSNSTELDQLNHMTQSLDLGHSLQFNEKLNKLLALHVILECPLTLSHFSQELNQITSSVILNTNVKNSDSGNPLLPENFQNTLLHFISVNTNQPSGHLKQLSLIRPVPQQQLSNSNTPYSYTTKETPSLGTHLKINISGINFDISKTHTCIQIPITPTPLWINTCWISILVNNSTAKLRSGLQKLESSYDAILQICNLSHRLKNGLNQAQIQDFLSEKTESFLMELSLKALAYIKNGIENHTPFDPVCRDIQHFYQSGHGSELLAIALHQLMESSVFLTKREAKNHILYHHDSQCSIEQNMPSLEKKLIGNNILNMSQDGHLELWTPTQLHNYAQQQSNAHPTISSFNLSEHQLTLTELQHHDSRELTFAEKKDFISSRNIENLLQQKPFATEFLTKDISLDCRHLHKFYKPQVYLITTPETIEHGIHFPAQSAIGFKIGNQLSEVLIFHTSQNNMSFEQFIKTEKKPYSLLSLQGNQILQNHKYTSTDLISFRPILEIMKNSDELSNQQEPLFQKIHLTEDQIKNLFKIVTQELPAIFTQKSYEIPSLGNINLSNVPDIHTKDDLIKTFNPAAIYNDLDLVRILLQLAKVENQKIDSMLPDFSAAFNQFVQAKINGRSKMALDASLYNHFNQLQENESRVRHLILSTFSNAQSFMKKSFNDLNDRETLEVMFRTSKEWQLLLQSQSNQSNPIQILHFFTGDLKRTFNDESFNIHGLVVDPELHGFLQSLRRLYYIQSEKTASTATELRSIIQNEENAIFNHRSSMEKKEILHFFDFLFTTQTSQFAASKYNFINQLQGYTEQLEENKKTNYSSYFPASFFSKKTSKNVDNFDQSILQSIQKFIKSHTHSNSSNDNKPQPYVLTQQPDRILQALINNSFSKIYFAQEPSRHLDLAFIHLKELINAELQTTTLIPKLNSSFDERITCLEQIAAYFVSFIDIAKANKDPNDLYSLPDVTLNLSIPESINTPAKLEKAYSTLHALQFGKFTGLGENLTASPLSLIGIRKLSLEKKRLLDQPEGRNSSAVNPVYEQIIWDITNQIGITNVFNLNQTEIGENDNFDYPFKIKNNNKLHIEIDDNSNGYSQTAQNIYNFGLGPVHEAHFELPMYTNFQTSEHILQSIIQKSFITTEDGQTFLVPIAGSREEMSDHEHFPF